MKSRKVTTVTSDEEMIRLDIYEGRIPLAEAGDRLLELALAQHHRADTMVRLNAIAFGELTAIYKSVLTPWPIRWWAYFRNLRSRKS